MLSLTYCDQYVAFKRSNSSHCNFILHQRAQPRAENTEVGAFGTGFALSLIVHVGCAGINDATRELATGLRSRSEGDAAICSGVCPRLFVACTSAPHSSKRRRTRSPSEEWKTPAVMCSRVQAASSGVLTLTQPSSAPNASLLLPFERGESLLTTASTKCGSEKTTAKMWIGAVLPVECGRLPVSYWGKALRNMSFAIQRR